MAVVAASPYPRRVNFPTLNETEWSQVDAIWDALEEGEPDRARAALDALCRTRAGHPDVRIAEAAVLLDEGEAAAALAALEGAERSADPSLFFHLRALAAFDLSRFEQAESDARRALAVQPALPEALDLMSRVCDHLGREDDAFRHAEEAHALDPEKFPMPLEVEDAAFDALVEKAVEELPDKVREELDELPVLVQPLPSRELLTADEPPLSPDILGLFSGRHLFERSSADPPNAPGTIFLFRRNLLRFARDPEDLAKEIRVTVQHEVGHLLGLDEDDLERWGLA